MNRAVAVLRLTRIEHSIMLVIAVVAAELLSKGLPGAPVLLLSIITPIFISMGSFAINDYFDIEVDRRNKKNRPLVKGFIKPVHAIYIAAISFAIGISASAFINTYAFAITLVFALLAFIYSYRMKDILLLGNAYIGLTMVIPFVFGNYVVSSVLSESIVLISVMVFLSGFAREIHGTIRDYVGDVKVRNTTTIPKVIGTKWASILALVLYVIAVAISAYLFLYVTPFKTNLVYGVIILVSDILLLYTGVGYIYIKSNAFYDKARNASLIAMSLALVSILLTPLVYI